jgi:hypothetical protein
MSILSKPGQWLRSRAAVLAVGVAIVVSGFMGTTGMAVASVAPSVVINASGACDGSAPVTVTVTNLPPTGAEVTVYAADGSVAVSTLQSGTYTYQYLDVFIIRDAQSHTLRATVTSADGTVTGEATYGPCVVNNPTPPPTHHPHPGHHHRHHHPHPGHHHPNSTAQAVRRS